MQPIGWRSDPTTPPTGESTAWGCFEAGTTGSAPWVTPVRCRAADVYIGAVMNTDLDADGASGLLVRIRRALLNDS